MNFLQHVQLFYNGGNIAITLTEKVHPDITVARIAEYDIHIIPTAYLLHDTLKTLIIKKEIAILPIGIEISVHLFYIK